MKFDRVRIEPIGNPMDGRFRVFLNDHEINCLQSIRLSWAAGELPVAELDITLDQIEVDREFLIYLKGKAGKGKVKR